MTEENSALMDYIVQKLAVMKAEAIESEDRPVCSSEWKYFRGYKKAIDDILEALDVWEAAQKSQARQ